MSIAKARLFDELTVQQLVEKLAAAWDDQEATVLALLAELLEANESQRGDEGVAFYYRHPLETENENGSVNYHPLKIPFRNIIYALQVIVLNDEWGMEDKRFRVVKDDYELRNLKIIQRITQRLPLPVSLNIKVSLSDIFVNKFEITRFLLDNDLPVPQGWREIGASDNGLTRSARSKGGKRRKYNQGLQEAINRIREEVGPNLTLGTLKDWFRNNLNSYEPYSFDPPIPNCDDLYIDGSKLVWKDREDREQATSLRSLEPYVFRANHPEEA